MKCNCQNGPLLIIIISSIFFVVGCYKLEITQVPTPWVIVILTQTASPKTPIPSPLLIISPTTTSNTFSTLIPVTPSLTPQPTLSAELAKAKLISLLHSNGDCFLPCLWGVTFDNDSLISLGNLLGEFGNIELAGTFSSSVSAYDSLGGISLVVWEDDLRTFVNFNYSKTENRIDYLGLYLEAQRENGEEIGQSIQPVFGDPFFNQLWAYYLLPQILSNYGPPSKILIKPFLDDPNHPNISPLFSLVLVYEEKGFFVEYLSPREKDHQSFIGCPSKSAYISLSVWPSKNQVSLSDIAARKSGLGMNELNLDSFQSLENVTNQTIAEFYRTYKNPSNVACIQTSINLWTP